MDKEIKLNIESESTAHKLNLGFPEWLRRHSKYAGKTLVSDIANGMDILGEVPITGGLGRKETDKSRRWVYTYNVNDIRHLSETKESNTSRKGWGLTIQEAQNGSIHPLGRITEELLRATPIAPRLVIREQSGTQDVARRVIGDLK